MKHSTPELMKFKKLQRRLGISRMLAIGLLESLWIATQHNAPRGDLGRFTNEEIAIEIGWDGDPDAMVLALVETGWLDTSNEYRLVIHDWHKHAPRYIHGIVAKLGGFVIVADCSDPLSAPTVADCSDPQSAPTVADCSEGQPNLTKPNLTKHTQSATCDESGFNPHELDFLNRFNATQGVAHAGNAMSHVQRKLFAERMADPWWQANWLSALAKFPLPYFRARGHPIGLQKFLQPGFVEAVMACQYDTDWLDKSPKRNHKPRLMTPEEEARWTPSGLAE